MATKSRGRSTVNLLSVSLVTKRATVLIGCAALGACSAGASQLAVPASLSALSSSETTLAMKPGLASTSMLTAHKKLSAVAANAGTQLFYDGFSSDKAGDPAPGWAPFSGSWLTCQPRGHSMKYCQTASNGMSFPTVAGQSGWTNYTVDASAFLDMMVGSQGRVMILGRVLDTNHYYDLEMRSDIGGSGKLYWYIGKQSGSAWTKIAGGPLATNTENYYGLRLSLSGGTLSAYVSYNFSTTYTALGSGTDPSYTSGGIGLQSSSITNAKFDAIRVIANNSLPGPTSAPSSSPTSPPSASPTVSPTSPSGSATPTPPPGASMLYQIGDTVAYPGSGDGQYTNALMFTNQWGEKGYHFHIDRTDAASPCNPSLACPYRQMVNVGAGPTELLWDHHYQLQWEQINNLLENGKFGRTLIAQLHPYGNANEITNLTVDSVDCGGTTKFAFQDDSSYMNGTPTCYSTYTHGSTDRFVWDFTLPSCPSDSGGYDRLYKNGILIVNRAGPVSHCDSTAGPWVGFGIYEYRWAEGGGASDMSEDLPINYLKIWSF